MRVIAGPGLETHVNKDVSLFSFLSYSSLSSILHTYLYIPFQFSLSTHRLSVFFLTFLVSNEMH
jgi:hypothetical protein